MENKDVKPYPHPSIRVFAMEVGNMLCLSDEEDYESQSDEEPEEPEEASWRRLGMTQF